MGSIHVNPVYPDYFVVFKSDVVHEKFKFKNYVNQEDRDNIQKAMNSITQNYDSEEDSDLNDNLLFEKAIAKMRREKEYNIGRVYRVKLDILLHYFDIFIPPGY